MISMTPSRQQIEQAPSAIQTLYSLVTIVTTGITLFLAINSVIAAFKSGEGKRILKQTGEVLTRNLDTIVPG